MVCPPLVAHTFGATRDVRKRLREHRVAGEDGDVVAVEDVVRRFTTAAPSRTT